MKDAWFNLPGVASIFIPKDGTAKEWSTSEAVTIILTWQLTGTVILLSTSNNLNCPNSKSDSGIK